MSFPSRVRVVEVGPRDGLQNEHDIVGLETKVPFVNALSRSGLQDIEVTSFVSPRAVPQLADAEELIRSIEKPAGVRFAALVPNVRGLERWMTVSESLPEKSRAIALFTAASETFNRRNVNAGIGESLDNFRHVMHRLDAQTGSSRPFVRGYISTAFICPYEGKIDPPAVKSIAEELFALGVDEVSVGDTIGAATPGDIRDLLEVLIPTVVPDRLAMHFHDTRGTALANVVTAMEAGITVFDSSAAGLGGCPFAPGAAGNLATEDLLYMLDGMGIETGVDLKAIVEASRLIRSSIRHPLPSKELQAYELAGF